MAAPRPLAARPAGGPNVKAALWFAASVLLFAAGVVYLLEPAKSLPGFLPGHEPGNTLHQISYAVISGALSVASFFGACIALMTRGGRPEPPVRGAPERHGIRSVPPADRQ